ncbi:MAG: hypothetical protein WA294_07600 [Acidobacteriaceae bacterium]
MSLASFDEFVQREHEAARRAEEASIDWQAEKEQWLYQLDLLYSRISAFLKPYLEAGQITMTDSQVELNEEHLGLYAVQQKTITIGTKSVTLEPLGTLQAGSRGRVDVVGPLSRVQMSLLDSGTESMLIPSTIDRSSSAIKRLTEGRWNWKIITRDVLDLNRDTFLNVLLEVANG